MQPKNCEIFNNNRKNARNHSKNHQIPMKNLVRPSRAGSHISLRSFATRHASIEFFTCNFARISCRCRLTVCRLMHRASAISLLASPRSISTSTSFSRVVSRALLFCLSGCIICPVIEFTITHYDGKSHISLL